MLLVGKISKREMIGRNNYDMTNFMAKHVSVLLVSEMVCSLGATNRMLSHRFRHEIRHMFRFPNIFSIGNIVLRFDADRS